MCISYLEYLHNAIVVIFRYFPFFSLLRCEKIFSISCSFLMDCFITFLSCFGGFLFFLRWIMFSEVNYIFAKIYPFFQKKFLITLCLFPLSDTLCYCSCGTGVYSCRVTWYPRDSTYQPMLVLLSVLLFIAVVLLSSSKLIQIFVK